MRPFHSESGSALIITMVVIFAIMGFSAAFMTTNQVRSQEAGVTAVQEQATRLAEAAIGVKIAEMRPGGSNPDTSQIEHRFAAGDADNPYDHEAGYVVIVEETDSPDMYVLGAIAQVGESGAPEMIRQTLITVWRREQPEVPGTPGPVEASLPPGFSVPGDSINIDGMAGLLSGKDHPVGSTVPNVDQADGKPGMVVTSDNNPSDRDDVADSLDKRSGKKARRGGPVKAPGGGGSEGDNIEGVDEDGNDTTGAGSIEGEAPDEGGNSQETLDGFFDAMVETLESDSTLGESHSGGGTLTGVDVGSYTPGSGDGSDMGILHLDGDYRIAGNSTINGIVVVDGTLDLKGTTQINGLVISRGTLTFSAGTPDIWGGVQLIVPDGTTGSLVDVRGNQSIRFSQEAIDAVMDFLQDLPVNYFPEMWLSREQGASGSEGGLIENLLGGEEEEASLPERLETELDELMGSP